MRKARQLMTKYPQHARDINVSLHCELSDTLNADTKLVEREGKLPADSLARTVDEIAACAAGYASDCFGRDFTGKPMLRPPYFAVRFTGALFHTQGGLEVDTEARVLRVLNTHGAPLPNLFSAGGAALGLSGLAVWGYLSGNGLLSAVVLGRLVGSSAARLASGTIPLVSLACLQ